MPLADFKSNLCIAQNQVVRKFQRLVEEHKRDMNLGRTDVPPPANIDVQHPKNRWRSHGLEFFAQWVRYIYEPTRWERK